MIQVSGLPSFWVLFSVTALSFTGTFQFGYQEAALSWSLKHFPVLNQSHVALYTHSFGNSVLLDMTILSFGVGAAVGFAIFGALHIYLLMRWAMFAGCFVMVSGGIAVITGILTLTMELFAFGRFLSGIGTGLFVGFQIIFINDVSLRDHRAELGIFSAVTPLMGSLLASVLSSPFVLGTADNYYILFCITLAPIIPYFVWLACVPYEPPLTYLIINDERRAFRSANFYHPDESADEVLAEAYNRIRAQPSFPSICTIWRSELGRKTLLVSFAVNMAASFSGERFVLYAVRTFFAGHTVLYFMCFFTCTALSLIVMFVLMFAVGCIERRTLLMISIFGVMTCEAILGALAAFRVDIPQVVYAATTFTFCSVHQLFFALAVGSLSWFFAAEISFAGWNAIVLSSSMVVRMVVSAIQPIIYSKLYAVSPTLSSLSVVLPLMGCFLVVFFYLPDIKNQEPNAILVQLGFFLDLQATEDEVNEVLQNMNRLWTVPPNAEGTPPTISSGEEG